MESSFLSSTEILISSNMSGSKEPRFGMARPINGRTDQTAFTPSTFMQMPVNGRGDFATMTVSEPVVKHDAFCDFCRGNVDGIRYKCVTMPDFDMCEKCYPPNRTDKNAGNYLDPEHLFYAIDYRTADDHRGPLGNRTNVTHPGFECAICDNPGKDIVGTRYTCVQCQINLCEICEFNQKHDPTHVRMKVVVPQEPALRQRKKEQAQQNKTSNPNPPLMRMGMPVNGRQDFQPLTDSGSHPPAPRMMMPVNGRQDFQPLGGTSNGNGGATLAPSHIFGAGTSRNGSPST